MNRLAKEELKQLLQEIKEREGEEAAIRAAVSIALSQYVKAIVCKTAKEEISKCELPIELKELFLDGVNEVTNVTPRIINEITK